MVVALRDVRVRGEIHTIIDYAADMLQVSRMDCTVSPNGKMAEYARMDMPSLLVHSSCTQHGCVSRQQDYQPVHTLLCQSTPCPMHSSLIM